MPIDALQAAMSIWQLSGLSVRDILDFSNFIRKEIEALKAGSYGEKYKIGMRILAKEREEVSKFLYERYSASEAKTSEAFFVRYVGGKSYVSRKLPLVSVNKFLKKQNPTFDISTYYSGERESEHLDPKELAQEIARWSAAKLNIFDGSLYTMDLVDKDPIKIGFKEASFLEYRATLGSLPDELGIVIADYGITGLRKAPLPRRQKYLNTVQDLLTFHRRICAGGVNVMFVAKTGNDDLALLLQRRSFTVSDEPGSLTVIPKAFHGAVMSTREEHNPEDTIYRECYEELFGGNDQSSKRYISSKSYLRYCEGVAELVSKKNNNHKLIPLSISWDLLRGNYQLNYCLYVEDPEWWNKYQHEIQVNWEVDDTAEPATLLSDINQVINLINRQDWAPEAYFTFIEGLRWLSENEPGAKSIKGVLPELILTPVSSISI